MKRRKALQYTGFLTAAGLAGGGIVTTMVSGCKTSAANTASEVAGWNMAQIERLRAISNVIIPATDTPGALDADIANDMAIHVNSNFDEEEKNLYLQGLEDLENRSLTQYEKGFTELELAEQESILKEIGDEEGEDNFFYASRSMTTYLFFTSEVGATQVLNHLPIPGEYQGCIDYKEVGSTWAIN